MNLENGNQFFWNYCYFISLLFLLSFWVRCPEGFHILQETTVQSRRPSLTTPCAELRPFSTGLPPPLNLGSLIEKGFHNTNTQLMYPAASLFAAELEVFSPFLYCPSTIVLFLPFFPYSLFFISHSSLSSFFLPIPNTSKPKPSITFSRLLHSQT